VDGDSAAQLADGAARQQQGGHRPALILVGVDHAAARRRRRQPMPPSAPARPRTTSPAIVTSREPRQGVPRGSLLKYSRGAALNGSRR
jgi:hypothetical protein